jgi:hypothetical protein
VQEEKAKAVVDGLQARGVLARVERAGVFRFGVRVPLGDGRQAIWDTDGSAGLEAQIMRDNVLVGFVPHVPGSERFTDEDVVETIASADYGRGG